MTTKTAEKAAQKTAKKPEAKPAARRAEAKKAAAKKPAAKKAVSKPAASKKPDKAKKPAAKPPAPKAAKAPAKPVASAKAAPKKAAAKPAKAAPKPAAKPAPAKAAAKPASKPKPPAKPKADAKPKAEAAPDKSKAAKPAIDARAAAKALKESAAKKKPETPAKKKPLVGQKPRSEKPALAIDGSVPPQPPKASPAVNNSVVKASPASAEAKQDFKVNDHVVYPAHGVGRIVGIEKQLIAGITNELFLIDFEQEKMKLRVPTAKAKAVGMRPLSDPALVKKAVETLKGRARIKRTMWSRRAQEYEAKINSGDIIAVAEVVRDLYRASDQPEQSYSERQLFEAALDRLAREVAAVNKTTLDVALADLDASLQQKKAA